MWMFKYNGSPSPKPESPLPILLRIEILDGPIVIGIIL